MTWTESAKDRLEGYLAGLRNSSHLTGADPVEVTEDIRRHISEEVRATQIEVVTSDDVDRLLRRIGAPETLGGSGGSGRSGGPGARAAGGPGVGNPGVGPGSGTGRVTAPGASAAVGASLPLAGRGPAVHKPSYGALLFFGVLLPVLTLGIELATHMCATTFFNPIPSWWHVALVGLVPAVNLAMWWSLRERDMRWLRGLGIANAFVLGVAFYYALLYLPLAPFALIGILFLGWGLLPLSPLLGFVAAWRLRVLVREMAVERRQPGVPGLWAGLGASGVALALLVLPPLLTRYWSDQWVRGDAEQRRTALSWLRTFGHERTMRGDCYGSRRAGWDGLGLVEVGRPVGAGEARDIYYLATGRAFNTIARPHTGFGGPGFLDEFSRDDEQGGTTVGGRVKGLGLTQSRLDGLLDADAAWSYVEWTLEFKNEASIPQEARAQIALPPGGVVSRLTLWVNGEEREAAFAGSGHVRAAYEQVVKVQRRDPVLVTSCGPDRVLMQCFPVPPDGGKMKVRLGITAPLHLEKADQAVARCPSFLERNFSVSEEVRHSVWVEGPQPLTSSHAKLVQDRTKPGTHALHGELRDAELSSPASLVRATRDPSIRSAWVEDPRDDSGRVVRQTVHSESEPPPRRLIVVVDGSKAIRQSVAGIAAALRRLPDGLEFSLLLARDGVEALANTGKPRRGDPALYEQAAKELLDRSGVGGQDNVPALAQAWDLAAEIEGSAILWVHTGQPQLFENGEMLKQRLDWRSQGASSTGPILYELQTEPGPDRVLERIGGSLALRSVPRFGVVREDVERLVARWRSDSGLLGLVRERREAADLPAAERGKRGSKHLARLWAFDEILRLVQANHREQAVQMAAKYQLVTPVSGAVVLENKAQFVQAGLQPADPQTVPMVPEPGTILLLALGGGAILGLRWMRWRNQQLRTPGR